MDIKEILANPDLLKQLKDALGLNKEESKSGFVSAASLGIPQFTDKQLKEFSKTLAKQAEKKSLEEIQSEIAMTLR